MREIKKVSWKEFINQFDPSVRDAIAKNRLKPGVDGVAMLQCEVFDSSRFGQTTALIYGKDCTFKTVESMDIPSGVFITGLPSSASFPVNFTEEIPA